MLPKPWFVWGVALLTLVLLEAPAVVAEGPCKTKVVWRYVKVTQTQDDAGSANEFHFEFRAGTMTWLERRDHDMEEGTTWTSENYNYARGPEDNPVTYLFQTAEEDFSGEDDITNSSGAFPNNCSGEALDQVVHLDGHGYKTEHHYDVFWYPSSGVYVR